MNYTAAAYTDVGTHKPTNQDSLCLRRAAIPGAGEAVLAVVSDGMGGLKKGEVASASAVTAFGNWFDRNLQLLPALCGADFSRVRGQWTQLICQLHRALLGSCAGGNERLGATVSAFLAFDGRYLTLTVGDSRIYECRDTLTQLTQDQSLVAREVALGRITQEESRHHPQRNVLLQCVGAGELIEPVFTQGRVRDDALYLLCTDGFVHEPSPAELEGRLRPAYLNTKDGMTDALRELTELCKARGETDNITALLLRSTESRIRPKEGLLRQFLRRRKREPEPAVLLETAQVVHTNEIIGLD